MKSLILIIGVLFVAAGLFFSSGTAEAHGHGFHGMFWVMDQLTEEQRAEVHETIDRMMGEGASPCEIHETVREMLEGYGVKPPCRFEGRHHGWDS